MRNKCFEVTLLYQTIELNKRIQRPHVLVGSDKYSTEHNCKEKQCVTGPFNPVISSSCGRLDVLSSITC